MKPVIIIAIAIGLFVAGYSCNRKAPVALHHYVTIPSTNHYEVTGKMVMRAHLPQTTLLEYSTNGATFTAIRWGNETFGDSSFGWYQLRLQDTPLWLRVLPDTATSNTTAEIIFRAK